jgi:hypothetical protein
MYSLFRHTLCCQHHCLLLYVMQLVLLRLPQVRDAVGGSQMLRHKFSAVLAHWSHQQLP